MTDIAKIAEALTKAQRGLVLASEPGGWGRDDTACGAPVRGAQIRVARALQARLLGDYCEGDGLENLYFNNQRGLAVRSYLKEQDNG